MDILFILKKVLATQGEAACHRGSILASRELSPLKKGEVSVRLTSLYLLVRNQLFQEELKINIFNIKTT